MSLEQNTPADFNAGAWGTHSPCIGVCVMDEARGICAGCARTAAELTAWSTAEADAKQLIWHALPERLDAADIAKRVSPLSTDGIMDWLADVAGGPQALRITAAGQPGARPVTVGGDRPADAARDDGWMTLRCADGATFALLAHDKLRLFAFGPTTAPTAYVLVLPKGRMEDKSADDFTRVSPSSDAATNGASAADSASSARDAFDLPNWAGVVAVITPVTAAPDSN